MFVVFPGLGVLPRDSPPLHFSLLQPLRGKDYPQPHLKLGMCVWLCVCWGGVAKAWREKGKRDKSHGGYRCTGITL